MAQRAETIVQLLFRLADESKPIRKALDSTSVGNAMPQAPPNGSASGSRPGAASAAAARSATPANNNTFPERDQGKKKRKVSERRGENGHVAGGALELLESIAPGDENSNPNGGAAGPDEEGEWGMSKDQRLRMFGNNQEAYELAEKDMRTITAKRTASQGGILPQQKTKYKKRSVS